jgi:hypothetical protein
VVGWLFGGGGKCFGRKHRRGRSHKLGSAADYVVEDSEPVKLVKFFAFVELFHFVDFVEIGASEDSARHCGA